MVRRFVNLTNGIEAIPSIDGDYSFVRIQSTACEQKRWDFILQDLDNNFLMSLALGHECIVYDFGARKARPRAAYQGIEFIKFALAWRWLGEVNNAWVKGHNAKAYFLTSCNALDDRTKKKLDYFKRFLRTDTIRLASATAATIHDNHDEFYKEILRNNAR